MEPKHRRKRKLNAQQVREIREWAAGGYSLGRVAKWYRVDIALIKQIVRFERWAWLDNPQQKAINEAIKIAEEYEPIEELPKVELRRMPRLDARVDVSRKVPWVDRNYRGE